MPDVVVTQDVVVRPGPAIVSKGPLSVLVCGLPSSGNHLVASLLTAAGVNPYVNHGEDEITTGRFNLEQIILRSHQETKWSMIIPVRDEPSRVKSVLRRWGSNQTLTRHLASYQNATRRRVLGVAIHFGLPVKMISYESIVRDPEAARVDILSWVGAEKPDTPWPEEVVDGNAKYA